MTYYNLKIGDKFKVTIEGQTFFCMKTKQLFDGFWGG